MNHYQQLMCFCSKQAIKKIGVMSVCDLESPSRGAWEAWIPFTYKCNNNKITILFQIN